MIWPFQENRSIVLLNQTFQIMETRVLEPFFNFFCYLPTVKRSSVLTIYFIFSSEGVVVAKKDFNQPKHDEIDTKNLFVIKALQSLTSRGYVKTQFSWQYYYYTLTEQGVEYLREYLHLPEHIVPGTYMQDRSQTQRPQRRY